MAPPALKQRRKERMLTGCFLGWQCIMGCWISLKVTDVKRWFFFSCVLPVYFWEMSLMLSYLDGTCPSSVYSTSVSHLTVYILHLQLRSLSVGRWFLGKKSWVNIPTVIGYVITSNLHLGFSQMQTYFLLAFQAASAGLLVQKAIKHHLPCPLNSKSNIWRIPMKSLVPNEASEEVETINPSSIINDSFKVFISTFWQFQIKTFYRTSNTSFKLPFSLWVLTE